MIVMIIGEFLKVMLLGCVLPNFPFCGCVPYLVVQGNPAIPPWADDGAAVPKHGCEPASFGETVSCRLRSVSSMQRR